MDASEAMTVLRNRCILSVFAAVSYPRSTVISMLEWSSYVNGQGDFLGKVKGQRPKLAVKILDPGRRRKNRVYGSDTP